MSPLRMSTFVATALLLTWLPNSQSQAQWEQVKAGLTDINVKDLAVSGADVFAGTPRGVYKSTDGGTIWTQSGLGPFDVSALALCGTTLFAGTSAGVSLSTNNGTTWTPVNAGLANPVREFFVVSGSYVFAKTSDGLFLFDNGNSAWSSADVGLPVPGSASFGVSGNNLLAILGRDIFLTTDRGGSWNAVHSGLPPSAQVLHLTTSPTSLIAVVQGTDVELGVFRTTDNGDTWTGIRNELKGSYVQHIRSVGPVLFAGALLGGFMSTNDGASWTKTDLPKGQCYAALGGTFLAGTDAGVFHSTNGGLNWTAVGVVCPDIRAFASIGTNLFAGIDGGGVCLSTNNGSTWNGVNTLLTNRCIKALVVSGTNLFAGTSGGGVFLSTNGGSYWTEVNSGLTGTIGGLHVNALAASATQLFAGTWENLYRSADNGTTWWASGLSSSFVYAVAVNGTTCWAGTDGSGISLSADNGSGWTRVTSGLPNSYVYAFALSGSNLFAGTYGGGVYRSTNSGITWTAASSGLGSPHVHALAVSGSNLFAGTDGAGVFVSTNNGTTWSSFNSGMGVLSDTALHIGDRVIVVPTTDCVNARSIPSVTGSTILKCEPAGTAGLIAAGPSSDINGSSGLTFWRVAYSDGINGWSASEYLTRTGANAVYSLHVSGQYLFAGGAAVWRRLLSDVLPIQLASFSAKRQSSGSTLLTWTTVSEINNFGFEVERSADGKTFTSIGGSFVPGNGTTNQAHTYSYIDVALTSATSYRLKQIDLDGTVNYSEPVQLATTTEVKEQHPTVFALDQNYPNPFNPTTVISFQLPEVSIVRLVVFDLVGREVAVLVNEKMDVGFHEVKLDASRLSSGLYFYRMQAGNYVAIKKMLVVK